MPRGMNDILDLNYQDYLKKQKTKIYNSYRSLAISIFFVVNGTEIKSKIELTNLINDHLDDLY